MKTITVYENTPIPIDEEQRNICESILSKGLSQDFSIVENELVFNDYLIGSFIVGDTLFQIESRHNLFSTETLFEMIMYSRLNKFNSKFLSGGYGADPTFGVKPTINSFCNACEELTRFGLSGNFKTRMNYLEFVKGNIIATKYSKLGTIIKGIPVIYPEFGRNNLENRIIKAALMKISTEGQKGGINPKVKQLLREFDNIDDLRSDKNLKNYRYNDVYVNPFYPIVMELAIIILQSYNLKFKNGNLEWSSFLVNSNNIFEQYVYNILKHNLSENVIKWDLPKSYGKLVTDVSSIDKNYQPDILIDYDNAQGSCRAVFDVKNKNLTVNGKVDVKDADIYQIAFYCKSLNTKIGALIYPTPELIPSNHIILNAFEDIQIFILGLNMNETINTRHSQIVNTIKSTVFPVV